MAIADTKSADTLQKSHRDSWLWFRKYLPTSCRM